MAAENVIRNVLENDAGVSLLVGTRIRPDTAQPNETLPYVVFEMIAADRWQAHDGPTGVGQFTYTFRCFSTTKAGATTLAKVVRIALDHLPETTVTGQTVLVITVLGSDEAFEYRGASAQDVVYESSIDMDVYVREAVS